MNYFNIVSWNRYLVERITVTFLNCNFVASVITFCFYFAEMQFSLVPNCYILFGRLTVLQCLERTFVIVRNLRPGVKGSDVQRIAKIG
jgi:hypothetical protein